MFNRLIASSRNKPHRAWNPLTVALSVGTHVLVFGAIVWAARPRETEAPPPPKPEEITYVDVSEIPPPPEPEVEPEPAVEQPEPQPTPTPPRAAPRTPRNPPPKPNPTEVAGTQELKTPPVVTGIPAPTVVPPVRAEDFGGRGAIGGTAAGTPPPTPPAATTGTGTGTGGGDGTGTYSAAMVDRRAELINREQISQRLQQLYPALLRDSGITGNVSVQMVVGSDGRVDMSTVKILSTSHEAFADATMRVLKDLRFRPAKMGDNNVRMLTVMPVTWNLQH